MKPSNERLPHQPKPEKPNAEQATVAPTDAPSLTQSWHPPPEANGGLPRQLPASFGRYRLLKLLGQGGMGAVYLAHDTQLDRPVALKMPLFSSADGAQVLARFQREARAAATVVHPNICPIHDVGEIDGQPYLTMTFVEGKPLADFVLARPLTPRQSAALVRKLALAVQEAHSRGVIHRDLKPANIMIDKRGEPVVMDFGLARRARAGDARLTQMGEVMGTPAYMPPEQVSGNVEAMGPPCDIYSLGVILYELLTGQLPFSGDPMAMLSQVLLDEPPPPSKLRPDLDPALEAICLKAMAKKIEGRHRSAGELAAALHNYLRATITTPEPPSKAVRPVRPPAKTPAADTGEGPSLMQATMHPPEPLRRPREPAPRRAATSRRRRMLWPWIAGGVLGMLLLAGVIGVLLWHRAPSSNQAALAGDGPERPRIDPISPILPIEPIRPLDSPRDGARQKSQTAPGNGFVQLFDGADLDHWTAGSGDPTVWRVRDGAMVFFVSDPPRQRGWLLTQQDYTDFLLRFEFQLSAGANSGVAVRTWRGAPNPLEIQIQDDTFPEFANQGPTQRTGTLFGLAGEPASLRPLGEWNKMEIELRGWSLRVAVNDRETLRLSLQEDLVYRYLHGAPPASGRIGLQHWRGSARFRKLELKDLSVPSQASTPRKVP